MLAHDMLKYEEKSKFKRVSRNYKAAREVSGCCSIIVIIRVCEGVCVSAFPNSHCVFFLPNISTRRRKERKEGLRGSKLDFI